MFVIKVLHKKYDLIMKKKTKKSKSVRKKLLKFFAVLFCAVIISVVLMNRLVNPIIKETGESKISESTNYAVNLAVISSMQGTLTYDDLIHIVTDANGKITLLQANSIQINALSRKVIDKTYQYIMERIGANLSIPVGAFSGIPILSGFGPMIDIPTMPYGSVNCTFLSKFVSAGINQTLHKIYLSVETSVTMVLPFNTVKVDERTDVLVSESLIIGEIPETYLMAAESGDMLNLVG